MSSAAPNIVPLGKVLREWGLGGAVKFRPYNPGSEVFSRLKKIYVEAPGGWQVLDLSSVRRHGNTWVFQFTAYQDPESSRDLRGKQLGLPREALPRPKQGEIYVTDLPGLEVRDAAGEKLGTVVATLKIGDNEVLRIQINSGKEAMVPFLAEFVDRLDLQERILQLTGAADELLTL